MAENKLDVQVTPEGEASQVKRQPEGRRSLLQIKVDILKVVAEGYGKPTQIMYKANLSWNVLQAQLSSFTESGLLDVVEYGNRRRYVISKEGVDMIQSYQKVVDGILL
jgi:predicted transcriptional regulator